MSKSNWCNVICSWNLPNAFHFIQHLDDSSQPIGVLWKLPFWKPPNTSTIPFETPSRSYDVCLWNWIVQFCADTFLSFAAGFLQTSTSWWFQPIWKIWVKLNHWFPQVGVKIKNLKPPPSLPCLPWFWWLRCLHGVLHHGKDHAIQHTAVAAQVSF